MVEAPYLKSCAAGRMEDILSDRIESPGRHLSATVKSSRNFRRSRRCCILDRSTGAAQQKDTHKKQNNPAAMRGIESRRCVDQWFPASFPAFGEVASSRTNALQYNAVVQSLFRLRVSTVVRLLVLCPPVDYTRHGAERYPSQTNTPSSSTCWFCLVIFWFRLGSDR